MKKNRRRSQGERTGGPGSFYLQIIWATYEKRLGSAYKYTKITSASSCQRAPDHVNIKASSI